MIATQEEYLDQEIERVEAFAGPRIQFSHIDADNRGLRPYQQQMKEDVYSLWDKMDNLMIQMPTGTGKTILFTSVVRDILHWCNANSPESKILIVAHRKELIIQASDKLNDIAHGIIISGNKLEMQHMVQVASIQTFMSRRNYETMRRYRFDYIIIDEAHHSIASGYQKLWEMYPHSKKLGVTATPWRMNHCGFRTLFSDIILSKPIEWFVNEHYLSNYDYISIKRNSETQKAINSIDRYGVDGDYLESELSNIFDCDHIRAKLYSSYKKFADGKIGIIYAIDRCHANNILNLYASHGVSIRMIDGKTPSDERTQIINDFKSRIVRVIVNVNIFSEGFDCPDIEFIQLARPTRSLAMYLQQVGRALRISKNKEKSLILDNVGLYNRFGTPMANRHWRHHFNGSETNGEEGWNDGGLLTKDIEVYEREPNYSEGNEEMEIVEHVEGKQQIRSSDSEDTEQGINDYNVFRDRKTGLYGVCDRRNRTIVQPMYEDMHPYYKGYISFKLNGKWGIMLKNGTIKVKPKYFYIGPFVDGVAEIKNTEYSQSYHINGKLEKID